MARAKTVAGLDARAPVGKNARLLVKTRLVEMYEWNQFVDQPERVSELHSLRIAAKRLRYTLEIFGTVLPAEGKDALKEVEQIQGELGDLHDSDVMITLLRLCLGKQDEGINAGKASAPAQSAQVSEVPPLDSDLVETLLDRRHQPSSEQRRGLELLLGRQLGMREEQYTTFREHWQRLRTQDFPGRLLDVLG
jgi:CHAD domain-containing protein